MNAKGGSAYNKVLILRPEIGIRSWSIWRTLDIKSNRERLCGNWSSHIWCTVVWSGWRYYSRPDLFSWRHNRLRSGLSNTVLRRYCHVDPFLPGCISSRGGTGYWWHASTGCWSRQISKRVIPGGGIWLFGHSDVWILMLDNGNYNIIYWLEVFGNKMWGTANN